MTKSESIFGQLVAINSKKLMEGLKQQGKLKGGLPFTPESAAVLSDNGNQVSNGFYTEPNNVSVGGYIELSAENLQEAISIAKSCPAMHSPTSTIEVRECMEMSIPA